MMLELRTVIEERLELELPIMALGNGLAPVDVVRRLMHLLDAKPGRLPFGLFPVSATVTMLFSKSTT